MNKKNIILAIVCIFSFLSNTFAQITVSGTVSDPNDKLVSNALVEIIDQKDSSNKYTTTTNASGYFQISNITDVEKYESTLPNDFLILRNYPNPFNPSTIIYFELPAADNIEIKIFDILGREVRSLFSGFQKAGVDQINWDGRNNFNQGVSAGIYLCQLKTKDNFKVHKMVLLDGGTHSSGNISYGKISKQNFHTLTKVNSRFNFTVKVTGDSLDATYFRNLVCNSDTTLNLIVSKIIKAETIGVEGGIVGNDDFKVSIPLGAFDGNYNVSLIKIEDDGAFGENTVTPSFKLKGIPNNFSKPIKIIAKYSGDLSGESFLGIGISAFDIFEESTTIVYNMYQAYDSLGYLISSIPASISPTILLKKNEVIDFDFLPVFSTAYAITNSDHFKFVFPLSVIQQIANLKEMFEDAYSVVEDGLQILINQDIDRLVVVKPSGKPMTTNTTTNTVNGEEQVINIFNINQNSLFNDDYYTIQVKATQELFSFTGMPEIVYYNEKKLFEGKNWIEFAIYCWIEDLVNGDPDYKYPKKFLWEGMESLYGFNEDLGEDENPIPHGRGMSALIKYLTNKNSLGIGFVGYFYKNINSYYTMVQDFVESIGLPTNDWWPEYLKELINNELYNLPDDYFITRSHAKWDINSEADVSKTFTSTEVGTYQDLSAKIFKINLNYADLDNTQNLKFEMMGPDNNKDLSLILFSVINDKLEFIETTQLAEYEIVNPKSYFEGGTGEFLAVLVNSNITQDDYLGESNIDLEIKVTPKLEPPALPYNICKITLLNLVIHEHSEYSNSDPVDGSREFDYVSGSVPGKFFGHTFKGIFEETVGNQTYKDTIEIALNATNDTIIYLSWQKGYYYTDETNGVFSNEHFDFIANNIELWGPLADQSAYFQKDGLDVCSLINYFYLASTSNTPTRSSARWSTGYDCTGTSRLQIEFRKE